MYFQQPIWFLLLIPVACLLYYRRLPSRLSGTLQAIVLCGVVLAMTGPMIKLPTRSGTIVVLADRSLSMPVESKGIQKHSINLLLRHIGKEDRLGVVSFTSKAYPERPPSGAMAGEFGDFIEEGPGDASNLKQALETALALIPVGDKGRLLVLSDGRWTGDNPDQVISRLVSRGVAVDYRLLQRSTVGDIAIVDVDAPDRVLPDEIFKIVGWVQVPTAQEIEYELLYNEHPVATGRRAVESGTNKLEFMLKAGVPGALQCELRVRNPTVEDPIPENNAAKKLIGVEGDKPLLVIVPRNENGAKPTSKLAEILQAAAVKADVSDGYGIAWNLAFLSRYSGIILENAPSSRLGVIGMELIAQWVRETGSGLMFTGGKNAYALGGYYQSPLDEIMPVSMELRKEHRKLAIAVAILMDCSGSMGMRVPGGKIKMDLANLGAAEVLNIMTPLDEVAVLTCDTGVQTIIALKRNDNPKQDRQHILSTGPGGGGIFVYTGLVETTKMLARAQAETKHVILFTDADDTEEPGEYVQLLENCRKIGMTCSVIALGTENGVTADLCRDIARVGGGSIYFTEMPDDLPRLFAQDTFTISRSTFLEDPTPFHFTDAMLSVSGMPFTGPPPLGGYNLCYLKPGALPSAITDDEFHAPVLAFWQAGLGRVLCYTGQVDGPFTGGMAEWDQYNSMLASLGRWTAGRTEILPDNMLLTQRLDDGSCRIRLHLDPEKDNTFDKTPTITVLRQRPHAAITTEKIPLRWLEPELLGVNVPLAGSETLQATLLLTDREKSQPFTLPPVCLPYSPEFRPPSPGKGAETLKYLASTTGGVERIELTGMWKDIPKVPRFFDLASSLIYLAMACLVLDIFQRRTGLVSSWGKRLIARLLRRPVPGKREHDPETGGRATEKSISVFRKLALRRERRRIQSDRSEDEPMPGQTDESADKPDAHEEGSEAASGSVFDAIRQAKRSSKHRTRPDD